MTRRAHRIAVLPGDGIGPEVTAAAVRVLQEAGLRFQHDFTFDTLPIGGAALRMGEPPLPERTRETCLTSDGVLLGAVGDPSFDANAPHLRPEQGLLALRKAMGVFANVRPARISASLAAASPLRADIARGVDMVIVRELTGGLYFGEPRFEHPADACNTLRYSAREIARIARVAFELARGRRRKVLSVDKANVLETSRLWRRIVTEIAAEYPDVTLEHQYVDSASMTLVLNPASVDVLLTENLFGDILSDEAGAICGSLGLLPSASLGDGPGLFEPVHGSAPSIANQDRANPIGAIASAAMLLRDGLGLREEAAAIELAIEAALEAGARTADIAAGDQSLGTAAMTDRIIAAMPAPARTG